MHTVVFALPAGAVAAALVSDPAGAAWVAATLTRRSSADPLQWPRHGVTSKTPGAFLVQSGRCFFIWLFMPATVPWAAADYVGPRDILPRPPLVPGTAARVGPWYDATPGTCALPSGHGPASPPAPAPLSTPPPC